MSSNNTNYTVNNTQQPLDEMIAEVTTATPLLSLSHTKNSKKQQQQQYFHKKKQSDFLCSEFFNAENSNNSDIAAVVEVDDNHDDGGLMARIFATTTTMIAANGIQTAAPLPSPVSSIMLLPPDIASLATATEARQLAQLAENHINSPRWKLDDDIWHIVRDLLCVRAEGDRANILDAFSSMVCYRFPGDILRMLMNINRNTPYPVPLLNRRARGVGGRFPLHKNHQSIKAADANVLLRGHTRATVHPGGPECFEVVNLPVELRVFELNTDWREHPEFNNINTTWMSAVAHMLDQLMLGSVCFSGVDETEQQQQQQHCYTSKPFPCPFEIEKIPFHTIAALCNYRRQQQVVGVDTESSMMMIIEILKVLFYFNFRLLICLMDAYYVMVKDWGLILRWGLAELSPSELKEIEQGRGRTAIPRSSLEKCYERATLHWLVQRLGYDRCCL